MPGSLCTTRTSTLRQTQTAQHVRTLPGPESTLEAPFPPRRPPAARPRLLAPQVGPPRREPHHPFVELGGGVSATPCQLLQPPAPGPLGHAGCELVVLPRRSSQQRRC